MFLCFSSNFTLETDSVCYLVDATVALTAKKLEGKGANAGWFLPLGTPMHKLLHDNVY